MPSNPHGYFDAKAREFVITRPDAPTPWLNYLVHGGDVISLQRKLGHSGLR